MWKDARTQVRDPETLQRLYTDLQEQDKLQRKVKKAVATGEDQNGRLQSEAEEKMKRVEKRYGVKVNRHQNTFPKDLREEADRMFRNERTRMLWLRAREEGFDEDAMEIWRRELEEYDSDVVQHESSMQELGQLTRSKHEMKQNTPDGFKREVSDHGLKETNRRLKSSHERLKSRFDDLEQRVEGGGKMDGDFFESKLEDLRQKAREMDVSDKERETIQSHLDHFEENLKKLKRLKEKMDFHEEMGNEATVRRDGDYLKTADRTKTEVKEKIGFTARALKKLYKSLVIRLGKKDEL